MNSWIINQPIEFQIHINCIQPPFQAQSMTDKAELESLARSLSHMASSINELLAKNNQPKLAPQTRIKRTSQMTYHDFLAKALSAKGPLQAPSNPRMSYRLQEDLELLLELSTYGSVTFKCFEEISNKKKVQRTIQSMRSRYSDYLSKVGEAEMKKIIAWVEKEGVEGFLTFEDNDLKISLNDPKDEKKEKKSDDKKRQRAPSLEASEKKFDKKKETLKKNIPTKCKELNDVLKLYSKMVNIPIKILLERLDQVSGDFSQLDAFIETKDSKLLWSNEEDDILRKGGVEVELLRKYRGETLEARKKYLGLS